MTFYRMTMKDVLDLTDKDTGDVPGDSSFVMSRKTQAYDCLQDPTQLTCFTHAQFSGDEKNSTDLVLQMQVEVDGMWGPYLKCNPDNVTNPYGEWNCINDYPLPPPNTPTACASFE